MALWVAQASAVEIDQWLPIPAVIARIDRIPTLEPLQRAA
jgi:hypothetical protein